MKTYGSLPFASHDRGVYFLNISITPRIILTLIAVSFILLIARPFLPDDGLTEQMVAQINEHFVIPSFFFAPEPRERISYLFALFFLPALLSIFSIAAWIFGKSSTELNLAWRICLYPFWKWFELCWIPIFLYLIRHVALESPFGTPFGLMNYNLIQSVAQSNNLPLFFGLGLFFISVGFVVYFQSPQKIASIFTTRKMYALADLISLVCIIFVAVRLSLIPETIGVNAPTPSLIHIGPIFEPAVTAYLSHATAGVDLVSQYGGMIEFARPFLMVASGDPIGLFWFAFFCLASSIIFIWLSARRLLNGNATLALIAIWGIIFLTTIKLQYFVCFQCIGFRWFWPSLYLLFAALELPRRSYWRWLPYFLFSFAIYWNPETGLACLSAWIGWRILANILPIFNPPIKKNTLIGILKNSAIALFYFLLGCAILYGYFLYKSRRLLDFSLFFQYAGDFYQLGFYMIPMPSFHLWNLYVLLSLTLFAIGIQFYLARFRIDDETGERNYGFMVFSTLLFGLLFAYYQGRSYYANLLVVSYPLWLAMVAWLGLGSRVANPKDPFSPRSRAPLQGLLLAILAISTSAMAITHFSLPVHPAPLGQHDITGKTALIEYVQRTSDGKRPFFVSFSAWRYALLTRQPADPEVVPLAAMFRRDQLQEYFKFLTNPELAVYFDLNNENIFQSENVFWRKTMLDELGAHFELENFSQDDVFIGGQGRLVRLREKINE